jgi:hypothetical protein
MGTTEENFAEEAVQCPKQGRKVQFVSSSQIEK